MKRQIAYGANTFVQVIIVAAVLVAVNAIARNIKVVNVLGARVPLQKQWDLTKNKRFSLSDQTVKILGKLQAPVKAIAFVQAHSPEEQQLESVLKRYTFESSNFSYQMEDPEKNPLLAKKYDVKQPHTVVLESKDHKESLTLPYSVDASSTESKITSGLLRILNPKKAVLYFAKGHGEMDVADAGASGLATLKTDLEGENYVVKPLQTFEVKDVPDDASAMVVAGTRKDFFPEEIAVLQRYLNRGGRILWLANLQIDMKGKPGSKLPNVEKFLKTNGIEPNNDLVVSTAMLNVNSRERILIPAGFKYDPHPITNGFSPATFFLIAQSLKVGKAPTGATVQPLVWTNEDTISYADPLQAAAQVVQSQNPMAAYDAAKDKKGPALLAVAATYPVADKKKEVKPSPPPAPEASPNKEEPKAEGRMVVFGNAAFLSHNMIGMGGNGDLAMNSIAWLAERTEQISISRPAPAAKPVALDEDTKGVLYRIGFPMMPVLVAICGIFVYMLNKR